jgi:hypothetical protein
LRIRQASGRVIRKYMYINPKFPDSLPSPWWSCLPGQVMYILRLREAVRSNPASVKLS